MRREIIAVPLGATVRLNINSRSTMELDAASNQLLHRVMPAQEPVSKSADLESIPFVVNEESYSRSGYNSREWVQVEELGLMRGVRVFALDFFPVRYDPVTGSLQVMQSLDLRVDFDNPDLVATADLLAKTASVEYDALYDNVFFNWDTDSRGNYMRHPTKYVILCPPAQATQMQAFADWKTQQGYHVILTTVGTGGTVANTSTAIKAYMQGLWDNATASDPAPTYLLIVGDESGSIAVATNTGGTSSHVTDLTYVRLNGTDYLPDMYWGRFSVSSTTELQNIIDKTVTFEKTAMTDLSYLGKTILIAGVDSSWAPTHGNGAINYATSQYFNTAHGINSDNYLYPASGQSAATIRTKANEGRGYINYTAHGSETSWYDPSFTTSHVNAMTNNGKYGVMIGNCCITNWFNYSSPCFGEVVIRKANAGGVAYIGGINSTYWDEDYYWAVGYKTPINGTAPAYDANKLGAYDAVAHSHGEAYENWAMTVGDQIYMGNLAVQQSGSSRANYYWEIYHIMGDPSLMPYMGVPTVNTATFPSTIMIGATSINITAAPYSRVALTKDGVIHATAMVPASGVLSLPITPFTTVGTAKLVITAQNKITRIEHITIGANDGPYMTVTNVAYRDGNNNQPEYDETGRFNVTFKNEGNQTATNVTAILTCNTSGIAISTNSNTIASLSAGASVTRNNAFVFDIANNVVDGTIAQFTITMSAGSETWEHQFVLELRAPALEFGELTISDPTGNNNGKIDPGETVTININLSNIGQAASPAGSATINSDLLGLAINPDTVSFPAINANSSTVISFNAAADSGISPGTPATLAYSATAGAYGATGSETVEIGTPPEVIIGTGTSSTGTTTACPINVWYQSLHGQSVYTKTELNAAGVVGPTMITKIGFNVTGTPALAMPNYIIRMGHTSASNVSSWIAASAISTVWTASSYQPSSTGWDMLTLTTPFEWNGVDNIVVDTAFGRIGSYSSSGTVQYTSVNSGYRYTQNDYSDQTNVFSSGSTSSYRPNLKLILQPVATGPAIAAEPESISKTVYEGSSDTASLAIRNTGTEVLNWSTPSSFAAWGSVSPTSGTIQPGGSSNLTLTLSAGTLALGNYNANLVITSNAENQPSLSVPITMTVKPEPEPIRFVAEWEPAKGAVVAYVGGTGFGLPMTVMTDLSTRGKLYVLVTSSYQNTARNQLQNGGATMSNVEFIVRNGVNTYWTRDYAAWTVFDANGEMALIDFEYNRPRPYDNAVPAALASYLDMDFTYMPLTTTGGNTMTDGNGKMMSTTLVQTENSSYTLSQLEDLVSEYLGVNEYIMYADPLANSTIDHIDCHAKILDVDKVMVARVASNHQNYAALENVANLFANKTSSYGTPYKVYRVDQSSNNEPYANAFIYNNKIYVPQWNSNASSYDNAAIAAYQAAMPGYTVQGYYNSSWLSDDALHCRVNTIHDSQLIHVWHQPHTSAMANSSIVVDVQITHHNPLNSASTYVAYRHGATGQWQYVTLTHVSGKQWTASIPTPALGQMLYYYILATDNTSRSALMPLCGASDPFALLINIPSANNAPTIDLPVYFEFDMNGSLVVDFAQYVHDEDGDALTLNYSGNTNVNVAINGLTVTFTATENWYGTENLTFTVSDGTDNASDTVEVRVILNWLATPGISITYVEAANDYVKVEWNAVPGANFYQVWASDNPYDGYSFLAETTDTHFNDMNLGLARRFYKVYASDASILQAKN
jgi:uncharacterized repeat protein (TIGR01451 family)